MRSQDKEGLGRLSELAGKLREISIKELQNQTLTDEEYELIRSYGGTLEHFWNDTMADTFEAAKKEQVSDWINPEEYPMSLVADVATGDGVCLEEAIGGGSVIYVVFPIDGELRIGKGCSFTYYQFVHPSSDRLTDSQWRVMKGLEMDENYEMNDTSGVEQPDWVNGFTYRYAYE